MQLNQLFHAIKVSFHFVTIPLTCEIKIDNKINKKINQFLIYYNKKMFNYRTKKKQICDLKTCKIYFEAAL